MKSPHPAGGGEEGQERLRTNLEREEALGGGSGRGFWLVQISELKDKGVRREVGV